MKTEIELLLFVLLFLVAAGAAIYTDRLEPTSLASDQIHQWVTKGQPIK